MKGEKTLVGVYTYADDAVKAIESVKETGLDYQVFTPTYVPELEHAVSTKRSMIGPISFMGGITGLTAGFSLAILTGLDWPIRVSAKDIVSIPGFVVVGYEWTILFGAIFTLLGMKFLCRIPNPFRKVGYDPRFSDDKFGVSVGCSVSEVDDLKSKMESFGADEVLVQEGL